MNEKNYSGQSGTVFLLVLLALVATSVALFAMLVPLYGAIIVVAALFILPGFTVVNPNESVVLVLFGSYKGTLRKNGFYWVNPLYLKKKISLRARNNESQPIKVNDKLGNPVLIGVVLVWRVEDTYSAAFEVDNYEVFVKMQSESAIRKLAGMYPYDSFDDEHTELSLRSGGDEINQQMEAELAERCKIAGIAIVEARISNLAYSPEIAQAMLQRQQATAVVAARTKIVEGAVGMVELALEKLSHKQLIQLDEERKAAMVSNLMVVLCSERSASPVVNTGTLHN
jgi:regulator of protease activity HflC (stomatin/prohibitin superfamily)